MFILIYPQATKLDSSAPYFSQSRTLAGHEKSSKHRKAEQLIKMGQPIRILRETDFREIVKLSKSIADPAARRWG
jgi:hypothetical protein